VGRSKTEILGQMLEIANNFTNEGYLANRNAVSKLKMMYKGFLPYAQLVEYVTFLLENGLLMNTLLTIRFIGMVQLVHRYTE